MTTLYFNIKSPLCSFGTQTNTSYRPTNRFPTKSAIIGLLCNAWGHDYYSKVKEDICFPCELSNSLLIAIIQKNDNPDVFVDYQNAKMLGSCGGKLQPQSDQVWKHYLVNSEFDIFIEGDDKLIRILKRCLIHPNRPLYLGRKVCPAEITNIGIDDIDIDQIIRENITRLRSSFTIYADRVLGSKIAESLSEINENNFSVKTQDLCLNGAVPISFEPKQYATWYYSKISCSFERKKHQTYSLSLLM